jgi:protein-L-isoaspartate(D-aspartate) O-methyltransferase
MVQRQLRARGIDNPRVLDAFAAVPRERFIPPAGAYDPYGDHPVPIGREQTISQPYVVALMVQALAPAPHHRILDVGAGSGYQAAVLSRLAGHVYAIERLADLAESARAALAALGAANVTLRVGDGSLGWPEEAPFDGIICGAASPDVPQAWIDQLCDGGQIVAPVGGEAHQNVVVLRKTGRELLRRDICDVRFVKLIGEQGWPS